jgi:hypothetical protein
MRSAVALDIETLVMPGQLIEAHAEYESECSSCHTAFEREKQNVLCVECHQEIGVDQSAPGGLHGLDPEASTAECRSCHTDHIGREANIIIFDKATFTHQYTDFQLLDKHIEVECDDCHQKDELYREAPTQCYACHKEDDTHEGGLGEECESCHVPKGWDIVEFEHEAETGFALLGEHATTECSACHAEQNFENTPTECVDCHREDDVHEGQRGDDCGSCHNSVDWAESLFDHARQTDFALLGAHVQTACEDCHTEGTVESELESTCISCHLEDDSHEGLLGEDCADCHDEVDWAENRFKHDTFTEFPLLGGHAELECESCHAVPVHEENPGTACIDCHLEDDPHDGQQGEACGDCHNETDWTQDVRFDHDFTEFPLVGSHKEAECDACHEDSQFQNAPTECGDCHADEDVHKGGLGQECGTCHNPVDWARWRFDHFETAGFVLDGEHADLTCAECHRNPPKQGGKTASRCIDCHRDDDVHNGQFGKDCARCHSTETFLGAEEL